MKLPEVLKEAILTEDWEKVCLVYTKITGEEISPPKKLVLPTEEDIIAQLDMDIDDKKEENVVPPQNPTNFITTTKANNSSKLSEGKTVSKKIPFKRDPYQPQLFVDDGTQAANDSIRHNPKLAKMYVPPRPRERKNGLIHAKCSVCGRELDVSPILATGYDSNPSENTFKCNDCIISNRGSQN